MPVLPDSRSQMLAFFETRIAAWQADPTAIGLNLAQVTDLATKITASRTAYDGALTIRAQSLAQTQSYHSNTDDLRSFGGDLIKTIKAYAESTGDDNVYVIAQVPKPADPTPAPPPQQPQNLRFNVEPSGAVRLEWSGSSAGNVSFDIWRSLSGGEPGTFEYLGSTGEKLFTDQTLPTGTPSAHYFVQARRGDLVSTPSTYLFVRFGTTPAEAPEEGGVAGTIGSGDGMAEAA